MYPLKKKHTSSGGGRRTLRLHMIEEVIGLNIISIICTQSFFALARARTHKLILAISSFPFPSLRQTKLRTRKNSMTLTVSFILQLDNYEKQLDRCPTGVQSVFSLNPQIHSPLPLNTIYNIITDCTKKRLRFSTFLFFSLPPSLSLCSLYTYAHTDTCTHIHIQTHSFLFRLSPVSNIFAI